MRRVKIFSYVMCLILVVTEGWCTNTVSKVDRWYWYPKEMDARSLSETEKREVIAEMRRRLPISDSTDRDHYRWLLLRLDDEQTMAELVKDVQSDDRRRSDEATSVLRNSKNPALIPHFAELLYLPEEAKQWVESDLLINSRPLLAALTIRNIIAGCKQFNPEMEKWALTVFSEETREWRDDKGMNYYEVPRRELRQLWEENKEAFLRHDYAAVKPPKTVRLPGPPAATNQAPPAATMLPPAVVLTQAAPKAVAPPRVTPSPTETRTPDWTTVRTVGVVLLALGVIGIVIWRVKCR